MNNDMPEQNVAPITDNLKGASELNVEKFADELQRSPEGLERIPVIGLDFARTEDRLVITKMDALGISPEILYAPDAPTRGESFIGLEQRMLALSRRTGKERLREFQVRVMNEMLADYYSTRTHLGHKKVRSASARKRKAQRQSMVKFSPPRKTNVEWIPKGSATGRFNITMPQEQSIPKPRTQITELVEKMKGFFK